jgi:hypothetical protein
MYRAVCGDKFTRWFVFVGDANKAGNRKFGPGNWTLEVKRDHGAQQYLSVE